MCFKKNTSDDEKNKSNLYGSFFMLNQNLNIEYGKIGKILGFLFKIPGVFRFPRKVATGFN